MYDKVFPEPEPLIGDFPRLVGLDGEDKMSKSLDNAIYLSDSSKEVKDKVNQAVTDPARIRLDDPGHPEVCTVYEYHQAFNQEGVEQIEANCRAGEIGCVACKGRLTDKINDLLEPMRERRVKYENDPQLVDEILLSGTKKARKIAQETMKDVRSAMKLDYFKG
jgi:tryptophanyl-tRNA synthetase